MLLLDELIKIVSKRRRSNGTCNGSHKVLRLVDRTKFDINYPISKKNQPWIINKKWNTNIPFILNRSSIQTPLAMTINIYLLFSYFQFLFFNLNENISRQFNHIIATLFNTQVHHTLYILFIFVSSLNISEIHFD